MVRMRRPTLHLAKDGKTKTWKVRYRDAGGRQRSETFGQESKAKSFARWMADYGVEQALELLAERDESESGHTVAEWCTHHIESLSGVQPDTLARYRRYVANDLGSLGHLPVDSVTSETIASWVNALARTGASGKTIRNKHGFLSAAFARAERKGLVSANPCKGTRIPRTEREPMVALSVPEYLDFLQCFTPYWQPMVTALFETGLRWGELSALRISDLDLDATDAYGDPAPTLRVERAWKRDGVIGAPKSERARRTIALSPDLADILRGVIGNRGGDQWVFLNQTGGPVRHATFHDNVWQPAVRLANGESAQKAGAKRVARRRDVTGRVISPLERPIGKRPRIHDARHSCASWLLAQGVPPTDVQDHLGHESFATTDKLYRHMMPSAPRRVRAALAIATAPAHPQIEA